MKPSSKALFWSIVFLVIGVVSWIVLVKDAVTSLPLGIFYLILLVNTYYSIKLFSSITPKDNKLNNFFDILLGLVYVSMALHLNMPLHFVFLDLLLFIIATTKYTFLINKIDYLPLLKKKILVDLAGCMLCTLTLGGMILGYISYSSWFMAIVFGIANVILFLVWPLYKID